MVEVPHGEITNVGQLLTRTAAKHPDQMAIAEPLGRRAGRRQYRQVTFGQLEADSCHVAQALRDLGAEPGQRIVLLVRPGVDFLALVFALFKAGLVAVLIDPGMGRRHLIRCLAEVEPQGFIAIPMAHAVRTILAHRFPQARLNVTVGRRWFWGGPTLADVRRRAVGPGGTVATEVDDPAAIIFTTGSTGPPKGVLYRHGNFIAQARAIGNFYAIPPGTIDLPCFPLFALFNCALGVSSVIPIMDPTRPAQVNPRHITDAVRDWRITQMFGSPALLNVVGRYCERTAVRLDSLRCVLSAGAPVPPHVLRRIKQAIDPAGDVHTPYGATEALPVASIAASEVLQETAARSAVGGGTCVGRRFAEVDWRVIRISDGPLATRADCEELPVGEIGELLVTGPAVTREYVTRREANALHKVRDGDRIWHRMGDVGYLDEAGRFWFCGRKAHRVQTAAETLFTIPCEAIFNQHPAVFRSALVGVGPVGRQRPVLVVETWPEKRPRSRAAWTALRTELQELGDRQPLTRAIRDFLWHPALPVDIRHNSKIFREKLAVWAARRLGSESA